VDFDWIERNVICRQAAWAAGERFQDFDCRATTLPVASFAARLAELAANQSTERGVCQQFHRAVLTSPDVSAGKDFPSAVNKVAIDCDAMDIGPLRAKHAEMFSQTYEARYAAAKSSPEKALAVCNEFRRSRGWPMDAKCSPADFEGAMKTDFAKSWEERFKEVRPKAEAAICDEYRQARGELPTGTGGCTPATADPLFHQTFQERYAATSRWLATPILSVRGEMGRATFKFRDAELAKKQETRMNYAVTGTVGVLTATDVLYALNYSLGRSFKGGDPIELCQPITDRTATTCEADVILSGPKQEDRHQLEFQLKKYLSDDVGAQLFVTRDLKQKGWGFEVPIHFLKDKEDGLAGGLVLSYRTDKKAFDVSVFIGQVFGVFN
jgi:hypothetical protein